MTNKIKRFKCKYCNRIGDRKTIRRCMMAHIKTDKKRRQEINEGRMNSNITENTIKEEWI